MPYKHRNVNKLYLMWFPSKKEKIYNTFIIVYTALRNIFLGLPWKKARENTGCWSKEAEEGPWSGKQLKQLATSHTKKGKMRISSMTITRRFWSPIIFCPSFLPSIESAYWHIFHLLLSAKHLEIVIYSYHLQVSPPTYYQSIEF